MAQKWYEKAVVQSAIVGGISLFLVSTIPSCFQTPKLQEKIKQLESESKNKSIEIQKLETQLIPFKTIALEKFSGDENERLTKLAEQIKSIQDDMYKIQQSSKEREIKTEHGSSIKEQLSLIKGQSIDINFVAGDYEVYNYALLIYRIFSDAGWGVTGVNPAIGLTLKGIKISINTEANRGLAQEICNIFSSYGCHLPINIDPGGDDLSILVGQK